MICVIKTKRSKIWRFQEKGSVAWSFCIVAEGVRFLPRGHGPFFSIGQTVAADADFLYSNDGVNATITNYVGASGVVAIPATLGGFPVTTIGAHTFQQKGSGLTSVTFPSSVTKIGNQAFWFCTNLTNAPLPSGLITIEQQAFAFCSKLADLKLPETVTSIGVQAFRSCLALTSVTIPVNVKTIDKEAFISCASLTRVMFNGDVPTTVGADVFKDCTALTTVYRRSTATGWGATFAGVSVKLWYLVIYDANGAPEGTAPESQVKLEDVNLTLKLNSGNLAHPGFTFIGWNTTADGNGVVYEVGATYSANAERPLYAMWWDGDTYQVTYDANGADSGTVPASQLKMSGRDLTLRSNLGNLSRIGFVFDGWETEANGSGDVYAAGGTYAADVAVTLYVQWTAVATYQVTYDANNATGGAAPAPQVKTHMVDLTLQSNSGNLVRTDYLFAGWNTEADGTGVNYAGGATYVDDAARTFYASWILDSGFTFTDNQDGTATITGYTGSAHDVVIPGVVLNSTRDELAVTVIGAEAFKPYYASLTSVTFPSSVTNIGESAFWYCTSLTNAPLPFGLISIGIKAFGYCTQLAELELPETLTVIGDGAFQGCRSLTSVTIPDGVTVINNAIFLDCSSLISVTIPDSVTTMGNGVFSGCSSLTSVTIPNGITFISFNVFKGCTSLTSVMIPDSVTTIRFSAFENCTGLLSLTIPAGVNKFEYDVFKGCTSLTKVMFDGDAPTTVGDDIFLNTPETLMVWCKGGAKGWGETFSGRSVKVVYASTTLIVR